MLDKNTYSKWTAEFMEGSYYEGSWQKGDRIKFLAPDAPGMSAVIADNRPFEFISIQLEGSIGEDRETDTPQKRENLPFGFENYTFLEINNCTQLRVDLDFPPEYEDLMKENWPKALARLKEICETHTHGEDNSNMGALRKNFIV